MVYINKINKRIINIIINCLIILLLLFNVDDSNNNNNNNHNSNSASNKDIHVLSREPTLIIRWEFFIINEPQSKFVSESLISNSTMIVILIIFLVIVALNVIPITACVFSTTSFKASISELVEKFS